MVDIWLGMGIDGLRLDAIPYLYEREGTNCENLPESHAFLKQLDLLEVVELDLNPVVATSSGVVTVDARLRIEARDPQRPEGSLLRAVS